MAYAAIQLLPGLEYLTRTTRAGFGYDAKANGFPLQDVAQFVVPGIVSLYSPLWIGITGLALALIALWRRISGAWFWGIVALLALLWSFGGNSVVYPAIYNLLPGLRFFRGQERAAYLVVNSLAILAGMGAAWLTQWDTMRDHVAGMRLRLALNRAFYVALALGALVFVDVDRQSGGLRQSGQHAGVGGDHHRGALPDHLNDAGSRAESPALADCGAAGVRTVHRGHGRRSRLRPHAARPADRDDRATAARARNRRHRYTLPRRWLSRADRQLRQSLRRDGHSRHQPAVAGRVLTTIIEGDLPDPVSWELFAVRYVFTDWQELPVPAQIVSSGADRYGAVNLHRLSDPRPFALLDYQYVVADDEAPMQCSTTRPLTRGEP